MLVAGYFVSCLQAHVHVKRSTPTPAARNFSRETFPTRKPGMAETLSGAPGLRSALMQNPRKRIKSLQLSCQAANSSWETTFSAPFAPRIFLTEKPRGRGSRKDALLRCDTHDMRRLLRRYLICFCLFQSRIFSGNVFPTDEERAGNTHSSDSCISLVSRQCAVYAWLP